MPEISKLCRLGDVSSQGSRQFRLVKIECSCRDDVACKPTPSALTFFFLLASCVCVSVDNWLRLRPLLELKVVPERPRLVF